MNDIFNIPNALKILLLDDHLVMTEGLRELIHRITPDAEISCFSRVATAKQSLLTETYHFLLSDVLIPDENMDEFIIYCRKQFPDLIIMMLSSVIDTPTVKKYFGYGINGYLSKAVSMAELKMAMDKTYLGDTYVSSDLSSRLISNIFSEKESGLTPKELALLRLIAAGHNTDAMANILNVSPHTVVSHRKNIMAKLDIHTSTGLMKYAYDNNIT